MTPERFHQVLRHVLARVKAVLDAKSAEYARGGDKFHNLKESARRRRKHPVRVALDWQDKHGVSIDDMLDDLEGGIHHPRELWEEKLIDYINYLILIVGILYEIEDWEIPPCDPEYTST